MTNVITLGERKGTAKCEPRMLFSAFPKKMPLSGKEREEIVKIYYLNGQNVAQTLRVFHSNQGLQRGSCTVKAVLDLIPKFEETDRPRSGQPSDPMGNCCRNSSDDQCSSSGKCMRCFTCSESTKFNCPQDSALCSNHVSVSIPACPDVGNGTKSITARFW